MKITKSLIVAGMVLANGISAPVAMAGDEPVNCRTEVVETPVYYGHASCSAFSGGRWTTLTQYVSQSYSPNIFISQGGASCFASLPHSSTQTTSRNKCDYTPKAGIRSYVFHDGTAYTAKLRLSSSASDRDGSIAKTEWWVNGSYYGASVPTFTVTSSTYFTIRQKVTDNSGLTDETTKALIVDPLNDPCRDGVVTC